MHGLGSENRPTERSDSERNALLHCIESPTLPMLPIFPFNTSDDQSINMVEVYVRQDLYNIVYLAAVLLHRRYGTSNGVCAGIGIGSCIGAKHHCVTQFSIPIVCLCKEC